MKISLFRIRLWCIWNMVSQKRDIILKSWYWTYLYSQQEFGVDPLVFEELHQRLKSAVIFNNRKHLLKPQYHAQVINELGTKLKQNQQITFNDFYENMMSKRLLGFKSGNIKLSLHQRLNFLE